MNMPLKTSVIILLEAIMKRGEKMGFFSKLLFGPPIPKKQPTAPAKVVNPLPRYRKYAPHISIKDDYYLGFKKRINRRINENEMSKYKTLSYIAIYGGRYSSYNNSWLEQQQTGLSIAGKEGWELIITNTEKNWNGEVQQVTHYLKPTSKKWEYKYLRFCSQCPQVKTDLEIAEQEGWELIRTSLERNGSTYSWEIIHFLKRIQ